MDDTYQKIIAFVRASGHRLKARAGNIADIGVAKQYVTEEDIRIERGLKDIIQSKHPDHAFYSEEENGSFTDAEDVWIVDPISGTQIFLAGLPHYGIAVAHMRLGQVVFGAVYDPSMDEMYTSYHGQGAFLNDKKISLQSPVAEKLRIIISLSPGWQGTVGLEQIVAACKEFDVLRPFYSHAVSCALVAAGKFHGFVCFGKDSFPYFAGSLMIIEAGGIFSNAAGDPRIKPNDRLFVGGDRQTYAKLKLAVDGMMQL